MPAVRRQAAAAAHDAVPGGLAPRPRTHARPAGSDRGAEAAAGHPGRAARRLPVRPPRRRPGRVRGHPRDRGRGRRPAPPDGRHGQARPARRRTAACGSGPRGGGRTHPTCPAARSSTAPSGRTYAGRYRPSTFLTLTLRQLRAGRRRRGRDRPGQLRLPARRPGRDPLPASSWIGSGRTPAGVWAGRCSTSAPSNRNAAAHPTSTPPCAARSPARSCARSPPRRITRCGGPPTTSSATPGIGCRGGTTTRRASSTPTPASHCRPGRRPPTRTCSSDRPTPSGSGRRCTSRVCSAARRRPDATSAT